MAQCQQLLLFDLEPYTVQPTRTTGASKPIADVVRIERPAQQLELDLSVPLESKSFQDLDLAA